MANSSYDEWAAARGNGATPPDPTPIRLAVRAAVHATDLTNNPTWDTFLGYIAGAKEQVENAKQSYRDALLNPFTVGHDDLLRAKIALADLEGQIKALDWIVELPKAILETGGKARELLKDAERED